MKKAREVTPDKRLNELVVEHVVGIDRVENDKPLRWVLFDPCNHLAYAFEALEMMGYRISVDVDRPDKEAETKFFMSKHGDVFEVSVRHNKDGPLQCIYDEKPGRALCLAMLFKKGVILPDYPAYLYMTEEEYEGE